MLSSRCLLISFIAVGVLGCHDSASPGIEKPTGKADEITRLCEALGEPTTCDPCDAANWYGDGVCDDFCAMPDTADCPAPADPVTAFLASTLPVTAARMANVSGFDDYRIVATELPQGSADAWAEAGTAMTGTGYALQILMRPPISADLQTRGVYATATNSGGCSPFPRTLSYGVNAVLDVVHWENGEATRMGCILDGENRVKARLIAGSPDRLELTITAQFSDGTDWVDRMLTVDLN